MEERKGNIFMKKINIQITFLLFLICTLCFLPGCQKEDNTEDKSQPEFYDFEAVTPIKAGQPNVYVVLKVLTSQYWQDIVNGITDAANENGCNLYVGATVGESEWELQQKLMERAKTAGADAIILAPCNSSKLCEITDDIHDKGVPVILVDTILNDTGSFDTCYMTDNLQAGELAAEEMIRLLKANGVSESEPASIAIQIASTSSQTVIDRLAGFNQYWSANAPRNWKVLDEVKLNNGDMEVAKQNCINFLENYPELKGVFGCNNSSTVGFVNGLTQTDRKDVILVGFDYADETAALVGSEEWQASVVVQNQYNMGYDGLLEVVEMLKGKAADYKFIDTGTRVINQENHVEYEQSLAGEDK